MTALVPWLQRHRVLVFCLAVTIGVGAHYFTSTRVDWGEVIASAIIVAVTNMLKPTGASS